MNIYEDGSMIDRQEKNTHSFDHLDRKERFFAIRPDVKIPPFGRNDMAAIGTKPTFTMFSSA